MSSIACKKFSPQLEKKHGKLFSAHLLWVEWWKNEVGTSKLSVLGAQNVTLIDQIWNLSENEKKEFDRNNWLIASLHNNTKVRRVFVTSSNDYISTYMAVSKY